VADAAEAGARLMKLEASNRARAKLLLGRFFMVSYPLAGTILFSDAPLDYISDRGHLVLVIFFEGLIFHLWVRGSALWHFLLGIPPS
jgi:hypothetical protein